MMQGEGHDIMKHVALSCLILALASFFLPMKSVAALDYFAPPFQDVQCVPLDLVVLVDQTIPTDIETETVKWLVGLMGYDVLFSCPDIQHRISVISLNAIEPQNHPLETISPQRGAGLDAWSTRRTEILSALMPAIRQPAHPSGEAYVTGIKKAFDLLSEAETIPGPERKQAVILIVSKNGSPYSTPKTYDPVAKLNNDVIPSLLRYKRTKFSDRPAPSAWLIAQTDTTFSELAVEISKAWGRFLDTDDEDEAGSYVTINSTFDASLAKKLGQIYLELNPGANLREACGSYTLPPFLESAQYYILKSNADTKVNFTYSLEKDGELQKIIASRDTATQNRLSIDAKDQPGFAEYYIFDRPVPGEWRFAMNCNQNYMLVHYNYAINLHAEALSKKNELPQYYEPGQVFDPQRPFYLKLNLQNFSGEVIAEPIGDNVTYQGSVKGSLTLPDASEQPLGFAYDSSMKSYVSSPPLPVHLVGIYKWNATFEATQDDGTPLKLASTKGQYEVVRVTPMSIKIEIAESQFSLHKNLFLNWFNLFVNPLQVGARLKQSDTDASLPANQISQSERTSMVEAVLIHIKTGEERRVWLKPSLTDLSLFEGEIGGDLDKPGDYLLTVSFDSAFDDIHYRFSKNKDEITISRTDSLVSSPLSFWGFWGAVLIGCVALFGYSIYNLTAPVHSGTLAFYRIGQLHPISSVSMVESSENAVIQQHSEPFTEVSLNNLRKRVRQAKYSSVELSKISPLLFHIKTMSIKKGPRDGNDKSVIISIKSQQNSPSKIYTIWREVPSGDGAMAEDQLDGTPQKRRQQEIEGGIVIRFFDN